MKKAAILLLFVVFCLLFVSTLKGRETPDETGTDAYSGLGALIEPPDAMIWYEGGRELNITDAATMAAVYDLARPCFERATGVGNTDSSTKETDRANGTLVFVYNEQQLLNWDPGGGETYGLSFDTLWLYATLAEAHVLLPDDDTASPILGCGFTVELYDYLNALFDGGNTDA